MIFLFQSNVTTYVSWRHIGPEIKQKVNDNMSREGSSETAFCLQYRELIGGCVYICKLFKNSSCLEEQRLYQIKGLSSSLVKNIFYSLVFLEFQQNLVHFLYLPWFFLFCICYFIQYFSFSFNPIRVFPQKQILMFSSFAPLQSLVSSLQLAVRYTFSLHSLYFSKTTPPIFFGFEGQQTAQPPLCSHDYSSFSICLESPHSQSVGFEFEKIKWKTVQILFSVRKSIQLRYKSKNNLTSNNIISQPTQMFLKSRVFLLAALLLCLTQCLDIQMGRTAVRGSDGGFITETLTGLGARQVLKYVAFPRHFNCIPQVEVAMSLIDVDHNFNTRITVSAQDISIAGFNLKVGTWWDTILYVVDATWIAKCD